MKARLAGLRYVNLLCYYRITRHTFWTFGCCCIDLLHIPPYPTHPTDLDQRWLPYGWFCDLYYHITYIRTDGGCYLLVTCSPSPAGLRARLLPTPKRIVRWIPRVRLPRALIQFFVCFVHTLIFIYCQLGCCGCTSIGG